MDYPDHFDTLRSWFPVPIEGRGPRIVRWTLLEGNRYAVTSALLSVTFVSILLIGTIWPFGMRDLLTETQAVQTILDTLLSGIILLVSIVVSINAIVLSHDMTGIEEQQSRIEKVRKFRQTVGRLAESDETPTNPSSFLRVMGAIIRERAEELESVSDAQTDEGRSEVQEYVDEVAETASHLEGSHTGTPGGEFRALWVGLETDYGPMMNRMRQFTSTYDEELDEDEGDQFSELMELFELFAIGREYFKTLYYTREISELSRTLLIISLPSIITTVWAILAINAGLLPDFSVAGLSPLLIFFGATFTIALAPFIVLTAYMLRVATVTRRTAAAGPFTLRS